MWVKKLVIVVFEEGGVRIGRVAVARGHCERGKGERERTLLVDRQFGQFDGRRAIGNKEPLAWARSKLWGFPRGLTRC